jgi:hypothetical protein
LHSSATIIFEALPFPEPLFLKTNASGRTDLENFGRALRLRWLWQEWVDEFKPWAGAELSCNETDRLLFNSSTIITIGDGAKAHFWHNSRLEGEAPRNLAPHLFELVKRKNKSVQQGGPSHYKVVVLLPKVWTHLPILAIATEGAALFQNFLSQSFQKHWSSKKWFGCLDR